MQKRIDFVIGSLIRGGAEHVIAILANDFANQGYDVNIIMLLHGAIDYDIDDKVNIINMYGNTSNRVKRIPYWIKNLTNHFINRQPDYVVSFVCRINILTTIAVRKYKRKTKKDVKLILSERNDPRYDGRGLLAKIMLKQLYPFADSIIFQSEDAKKLFSTKIQSKGVVIKNPIELKAKIVEPKDREKIIITAGRMSKQKNHMLLIKSFNELIKDNKYSDYQLHIYGDGELRKDYEKYISDNHLENNIKIFNNFKDIQEKVANSKLFVLSSLYEGMSNSLMEAIALGVPSISTNTLGAKELINDSVNGYIVDNNVDSMATTIKKVLDLDKKQYDNMCHNCLEKAKEYYPSEKIIEEYKKVILQ